jgi:hypothetical protein
MRVSSVVAHICVTLTGFAIAASTSAATVDDADVELLIEFDSGLGNLDSVEQEYEVESLSASQPIAFSATQSSGTATAQAGFNGAIAFDGDIVTLAINPGLLVSQTMPMSDDPAVMVLEFDSLDLEAEEDDLFGGFVISPFTLRGDIVEEGHARLRADLELSVEGPETEIEDRRVSFDRTFEDDFQMTSAELFGAMGLLGVDLSTTDFEELELSGRIWFEALGGTAATQMSIVMPAGSGTSTSGDPLEEGEPTPEPSSVLLGFFALAAVISYRCWPNHGSTC